ncbi:MAG TPA: hypothetical protein DD979_09400 [Gammaproteobacteria bacterium]|nr:hypothetical protein [Gammaproteobacteria bacterium]
MFDIGPKTRFLMWDCLTPRGQLNMLLRPLGQAMKKFMACFMFKGSKALIMRATTDRLLRLPNTARISLILASGPLRH